MKEKKLIINSSNNPFNLFKEWFDEAQKNEINDANAMNLSTISKFNFPSSILYDSWVDCGCWSCCSSY